MIDTTKPHGTIYIDTDGNASFDCATPANCTFETSLEVFHKFIALLQSKVDTREQCPYYKHKN